MYSDRFYPKEMADSNEKEKPSLVTEIDRETQSPMIQEFLQLHSTMTINMSGSVLDLLFESHAELPSKINKSKMVQSLRDQLEQKLRDSLTEGGLKNIKTCENELRVFKKLYGKRKEKVWRPTGKDVEEQVAPTLIEFWKRKNEALNTIVKTQQGQQLEELLPLVEEKRKLMRSFIDANNRDILQMRLSEERVAKEIRRLNHILSFNLLNQINMGP